LGIFLISVTLGLRFCRFYLPRFLLEEFTDPRIPSGQTPYLWVRNKGTSEWRRRAPTNVAAESDFYVFEDHEGKRREDIEQVLQLLED
jgi:hypothetical protein